VIPESILGRLIHSSKVQDISLVRLDVIAVYLLQHLHDTGMLEHMCFKGGISLRKVFARQPARFSRDIDFVDASYQQLSDTGVTADEYYFKLLEGFDNQTVNDIQWKVKSLKDEELDADSLRVDMHFFVYDDRPDENWQQRADNVLSLECSFRRPILLPKELRPLRNESWFKHLEFDPAPVPVLQLEEAVSEKIRAAFQRNNPRDIYDLYEYGQVPFDETQVRTMTTLKCWQDRGTYTGPKNFDPQEFLAKLDVGNYAWERLKAQVSEHAWIEPVVLLKNIRERFSFLEGLAGEEQDLCNDRGKKQLTLHNNLWETCKQRYREKHSETA
jgi:predicted nucleotidyltransferase component of viral defense system